MTFAVAIQISLILPPLVIHQWHHIHTHHRRCDRISSKQLETPHLAPSADAAGAAEGKQLSLCLCSLSYSSPSPRPHFRYSRLHWSRNQLPLLRPLHQCITEGLLLLISKNLSYTKVSSGVVMCRELRQMWPAVKKMVINTAHLQASKLFKTSSTEKLHLHFKVFVLRINRITQEGCQL